MQRIATPSDFAEAIQSSGLMAFYQECTDAHKREYVKWIEEAKKPETRAKRIGKCIGMLQAKAAKEKRKNRHNCPQAGRIRPGC